MTSPLAVTHVPWQAQQPYSSVMCGKNALQGNNVRSHHWSSVGIASGLHKPTWGWT